MSVTKEAMEKQRLLTQAESDKLEEMTREFQEGCEHVWDPVYRYDYPQGQGSSPIRSRLLVRYVCSKCDLTKPKRKGFADRVCQFCDGDMEHTATIPGQGERHRVYRCKDCSGEVVFT